MIADEIGLILMLAAANQANLSIPVDRFTIPNLAISCSSNVHYSRFYVVEIEHRPARSWIEIDRSYGAENLTERTVLEYSVKSIIFNGGKADGTWLVKASGSPDGKPVEFEIFLRAGSDVPRSAGPMSLKKNGVIYRNEFCMFMPRRLTEARGRTP
jgi:hypothetical protein